MSIIDQTEYAAQEFEPIPEFQAEDALRKFQGNLKELCLGAQMAFGLLRMTKAKLIESNPTQETANALAE